MKKELLPNNFGAIVPPIFLSTIFAQETPGVDPGYEYSRVGNPTREETEAEIASLEGARHGLVFSSGSAAAATVLASLSSGDKVLCSQDVYEGTYRLLNSIFRKFNISTEFADFSDFSSIESKMRADTKLVWVESVSNPLLKVADIKSISRVAKKNNALLLVDNTFATPIFSKPLEVGADIVLHSLTKYIGGHHDVTAGALALNNSEIYQNLQFLQFTIGAVASPLDCFLVSRGIKTLDVRMERHQQNARIVNEYLKSFEKIEKVNYPGISGMVSFWVRGGKEKTIRFLQNLEHIKIAHSLGGPETTIQHPRSMMSFTETPDELDKKGVTFNLVRMSVGLENPELIINDISNAINKKTR